jgi:hypothetical protein
MDMERGDAVPYRHQHRPTRTIGCAYFPQAAPASASSLPVAMFAGRQGRKPTARKQRTLGAGMRQPREPSEPPAAGKEREGGAASRTERHTRLKESNTARPLTTGAGGLASLLRGV